MIITYDNDAAAAAAAAADDDDDDVQLHRSGVFTLVGAENPQAPGYTSYRTSKRSACKTYSVQINKVSKYLGTFVDSEKITEKPQQATAVLTETYLSR